MKKLIFGAHQKQLSFLQSYEFSLVIGGEAIVEFPPHVNIIYFLQNRTSSFSKHIFYQQVTNSLFDLLETTRKNQQTRIIFTLPAQIYGEQSVVPVLEDFIKQPITTVGKAAQIIMTIAQEVLGETDEISCAFTIYPTLVGRDQLCPISVLLRAVQENKPAELYIPEGAHVQSKIYDLIHPQDFFAGCRAIFNHLEGGGPADLFNLSMGRFYSIHDLVQVAERVVGKRIDFRLVEQDSTHFSPLLSSKKAQQILGWHPSHTSLELLVQLVYAQLLHETV